MHNLRDYLFVLTSVKTYLSLLYKKHPKKGAFCVLYYNLIVAVAARETLPKPSFSPFPKVFLTPFSV